jgi:hypothetical protein
MLPKAQNGKETKESRGLLGLFFAPRYGKWDASENIAFHDLPSSLRAGGGKEVKM